QFDRILDGAQRIFLTADLFPWQFGNGFQIIFFGFGVAQHFDCDSVVGIDPYFIAYLQRFLHQILRPLQHDRLNTMLHTNPEPVGPEKFGNLRDRSRQIVTQISDNNVRLIHQDPCTLLQLRDADSRINIAIIVGSPHNNLGSLLIGTAEKRPDAIRRRRYLLNYLVEFLDGMPSFTDHLLLLSYAGPQVDQFPSSRVTWR